MNTIQKERKNGFYSEETSKMPIIQLDKNILLFWKVDTLEYSIAFVYYKLDRNMIRLQIYNRR